MDMVITATVLLLASTVKVDDRRTRTRTHVYTHTSPQPTVKPNTSNRRCASSLWALFSFRLFWSSRVSSLWFRAIAIRELSFIVLRLRASQSM